MKLRLVEVRRLDIVRVKASMTAICDECHCWVALSEFTRGLTRSRFATSRPTFSARSGRAGYVPYWPEPADDGGAEHIGSALVHQTSTCSATASASSTSRPK